MSKNKNMKNIVYTEVLSASKRAAFTIALGNFPQLELREIETPKIADVTPLSYAETGSACQDRMENFGEYIKNMQPGDIAIAIQKGLGLKDGCGLIASIAYGTYDLLVNEKVFASDFSDEIYLPFKLRMLVDKGMPLYDAYIELFGEEIKTTSLCEYMTGEKEEVWLSRLIVRVLLPIYGKHAELFKIS